MKPVTLPLLKSLYYVLFAMVVVIVLGGCEKDDENEIRFYTGNGSEERLLGEEGLLMDVLQTPAMIFLKAASGDQIKVRSEDTAVVDATYNPDYLGKDALKFVWLGLEKLISVYLIGEKSILFRWLLRPGLWLIADNADLKVSDAIKAVVKEA